MPADILDDLAKARRKFDAAGQALERVPELDTMRAGLERMAAELERIEKVVAAETAWADEGRPSDISKSVR